MQEEKEEEKEAEKEADGKCLSVSEFHDDLQL